MTAKQASYFFVVFLCLLGGTTFAQTGTDWLENTMFASGKINVVVAVVASVFVLIVLYLISIDRKLKKLEDKENGK